jgi:hypothetical protein
MSAIDPSQQQRVDNQPDTVSFVIALQHALNQCQCLFEGEILRMERRDRALAPEVPQQPLLGDAFGDPRHDPLLQTPEPCGGRW